MDNQKDNKKNRPKDDQKRHVALYEDRHFGYVAKKIEKLTTALHLITNFFPTDEPLRQSIRQNGLALLSQTYAFKNQFVSDGMNAVSLNLSGLIEETLSLLRIAHMSGFVTDMNFTILEREFTDLKSRIGDNPSLAPSPQFSKDFFDTEDTPQPQKPVSSFDTTKSPKPPAFQGSQEPKEEEESTTQQTTQRPKKNSTSRSSAKKKRRKIILGLFQDNDEVTVSDVKEVIKGYSSKTIQRDLSALVDEGVLVKEGKRRWTSYKLADGA